MMKINDVIEINGSYYPIVRDMTSEEEEKLSLTSPPEFEIEQLKQQLAKSDYKAIKYAEGWYADDEYAPIKDERETLRERIRELEEKNE